MTLDLFKRDSDVNPSPSFGVRRWPGMRVSSHDTSSEDVVYPELPSVETVIEQAGEPGQVQRTRGKDADGTNASPIVLQWSTSESAVDEEEGIYALFPGLGTWRILDETTAPHWKNRRANASRTYRLTDTGSLHPDDIETTDCAPVIQDMMEHLASHGGTIEIPPSPPGSYYRIGSSIKRTTAWGASPLYIKGIVPAFQSRNGHRGASSWASAHTSNAGGAIMRVDNGVPIAIDLRGSVVEPVQTHISDLVLIGPDSGDTDGISCPGDYGSVNALYAHGLWICNFRRGIWYGRGHSFGRIADVKIRGCSEYGILIAADDDNAANGSVYDIAVDWCATERCIVCVSVGPGHGVQITNHLYQYSTVGIRLSGGVGARFTGRYSEGIFCAVHAPYLAPKRTVIDLNTWSHAEVEFRTIESVSSDQLTITDHRLIDGLLVVAHNDGGTLPAGLLEGHDVKGGPRYFVKVIDADTVELYSDYGLTSQVSVSGSGTGTSQLVGGSHVQGNLWTIRGQPPHGRIVFDGALGGGDHVMDTLPDNSDEYTTENGATMCCTASSEVISVAYAASISITPAPGDKVFRVALTGDTEITLGAPADTQSVITLLLGQDGTGWRSVDIAGAYTASFQPAGPPGSSAAILLQYKSSGPAIGWHHVGGGVWSHSGTTQSKPPISQRGVATISGLNTSVAVSLPATEPESDYLITLTSSLSSGALAGSNRVYVDKTTIATTGFTIRTEVAPGVSEEVDVHWTIGYDGAA